MKPDKEGFWYPVIRKDLCTNCGLCAHICPIAQEPFTASEKACFGARAKEDEVRQMGSSGGIFPLLARNVLRAGGTVWGAAFSNIGTVRHVEITEETDVVKIFRTKYVQSDMSLVWEKIRTSVRQGQTILFCGTPCQTDAVRSFIGQDRGNLILADLICYGVPSPEIWKCYTEYLSQMYGGELRSFSFRDKRNGDNGHTCAVQIGEQEYAWPLSQDLYCRTMFRNINLRPSCFRCRYCTTARKSDITIGDFWGIEKIHPGLDDGMGCSAVICHTKLGRRLWEQIKPEVRWFACSEQEVANDMQPRLREPVKQHQKRGLYMGMRKFLPFPLWLRLFR